MLLSAFCVLLQGILSTGGPGSMQRVRWADEGADQAAGFSVGGASREQVSLLREGNHCLLLFHLVVCVVVQM